MRIPLSSAAVRRHPPTASEAAIRAACEARAAAAALAHSEGREAVPYEPVAKAGRRPAGATLRVFLARRGAIPGGSS
jgi:hypothetical protein